MIVNIGGYVGRKSYSEESFILRQMEEGMSEEQQQQRRGLSNFYLSAD
jgi:hypothetical protein